MKKDTLLPPVRAGTIFRCSNKGCRHVIAVLNSVPQDGSRLTLENFTVYGDEAQMTGHVHCLKCGSTTVDIFIPDALGPEKVVNPLRNMH